MELKTIEDLTEILHYLPSIGRKSAERMAYQMLEMDESTLQNLSTLISELHQKVTICPTCGAYKENKCFFCDDETRDTSSLIVVTSFKDALAFENLKTFHGKYHILGGNLSPSRGISVKDLRIDSLIKRIEKEKFNELILATDPTIDGETTALYIAKLLENEDVKVSRLAYGLPMGGHLTYADELTLLRSLEGRKSLK